MSLLLMNILALAAAEPACPSMEGVWAQGRGERIMVVEQEACLLRGTVREPQNQTLHVRGFWTGAGWTMAASRTGLCATTAWGSIRAREDGAMLVTVRGSDGLCGENGAPDTGPVTFNAAMIYRRVAP